MPNTRLKLLGNYLRPHWQTVGFGILSLFLVNGIGVYIPLLIQRAIDDLQITFTITKLEGYALQILVWASAMLLIRMVSRILIFG
ncbi:MAG: ABC transporter ATP-binding protein, partial [Synechococcales cyanobacterium]